jgi:hypothetical protein
MTNNMHRPSFLTFEHAPFKIFITKIFTRHFYHGNLKII